MLASQEAQAVLEVQDLKAVWEKWEYQVGLNISYLYPVGDSLKAFPKFLLKMGWNIEKALKCIYFWKYLDSTQIPVIFYIL